MLYKLLILVLFILIVFACDAQKIWIDSNCYVDSHIHGVKVTKRQAQEYIKAKLDNDHVVLSENENDSPKHIYYIVHNILFSFPSFNKNQSRLKFGIPYFKRASDSLYKRNESYSSDILIYHGDSVMLRTFKSEPVEHYLFEYCKTGNKHGVAGQLWFKSAEQDSEGFTLILDQIMLRIAIKD